MKWISGAAPSPKPFPRTEALSGSRRSFRFSCSTPPRPLSFPARSRLRRLSPPCAGLAVLEARAGARRSRLRDNADFLREGLRELGYDTGRSETAIVPVILNDERPPRRSWPAACAKWALPLRPILFPAVPLGSARLRLCVTAAHSIEDLEFALNAFREIR